MSNFVTSHYRRARKAHKCAECGHPIAPGDKYLRMAGATDGYGWSVAFCLPCDGLLEFTWGLAKDMHEEDGPRFGGVVEWLCDFEEPGILIREMPAAVVGHFAGLLFAAKERAEAARRLTITGPLPGDRERVRG